MRQLQTDPKADDRLRAAAENLRRILDEIAPYERKLKVEEISTTGTWRTSEAIAPHAGPQTDF
jgi:hypothetical protein